MGKRFAAIILQAFIYSLVFWLSWIFIFRPVAIMSSKSTTPTDLEDKRQSEIYTEQLKKANDQLEVIESQQRRMDALLSEYEQQSKRYEKVLERWEQQVGIRK